MKFALSLVFVWFAANSLFAAPLTESEAISKVKELPEFIAYSKKHKYAFDDNELIKSADGSVWRIDVRAIVSDSKATHLALWNRFFVNASSGVITVWDRVKADESVLSLKEWRSSLSDNNAKAEQDAAANP